jgi:hypothetical protein
MKMLFRMLITGLLGVAAFSQDMKSIKIVVIEGDDAQNLAGARRGSPVAIEVRDDRDRIVPAARVQLTFPEDGPGGSIGGQRVAVTWTDTSGRAYFDGFVPNEQIGEFRVAVAASAMGRQAKASFREVNVDRETESTKAHRISHKGRNRAILGAVAGGAALTAILILTLGSAPAVAAAVGSVSVGAPR